MNLTREQLLAILIALWEEGANDIDFADYESVITVLSAQIDIAYEYIRNYLLTLADASIVDRKWQDGNGLPEFFDGMLYRLIVFITEHIADEDLRAALAGYMAWNAQRILDTEETRCKAEDFISKHTTYTYHAVMDDATCDACKALNGHTFYSRDAVAGYNYPPMHPNCRCWISES